MYPLRQGSSAFAVPCCSCPGCFLLPNNVTSRTAFWSSNWSYAEPPTCHVVLLMVHLLSFIRDVLLMVHLLTFIRDVLLMVHLLSFIRDVLLMVHLLTFIRDVLLMVHLLSFIRDVLLMVHLLSFIWAMCQARFPFRFCDVFSYVCHSVLFLMLVLRVLSSGLTFSIFLSIARRPVLSFFANAFVTDHVWHPYAIGGRTHWRLLI